MTGFWDYSLELYARPGVADACLRLQDEYGLDVNLVLLCAWHAAAGRSAINRARFSELIAAHGPWQARVVQPLREVRRLIKAGVQGIDAGLASAARPAVQTAELAAERVEQLSLEAAVLAWPDEPGDRGNPAALATDSLDNYFAAAGVDADTAARELAAFVVAAAFGAG